MNSSLRLMTAAAVAVVIAGSATAASAQQMNAGDWAISFDLGSEAAGPGDLHGAGNGTVLGLPTAVEARTYGDVLGNGFTWAATVARRVGTSGEIRVSGTSTSSTSDRLQVGTVAGLPLFGQWDDYKAFGMDAGYRQYLGSRRARPYVGGSIGFVRLSEASAEFTVPAAGVTLSDVGFFDASTVPSFGFGVGLQIGLTAKTAFQTGIDFKWHGAFADRDGLAGTGLEPINDETSRWAMPITAGFTVRF
jgi:hypothetical protein